MADKKKKKIAKRPDKPVEKSAQASKKSNTQGVDNAKGKPCQEQKEQQNQGGYSVSSQVSPYVFMIFAIVLAIAFVTVRVIGIDDGAGVIGYALQWLVCGMFGSAAFVFPAVLFYLGVKKCIYNVRWSPKSHRKPTADSNRSVDKKKLNAVSLTSISFVVILSVIFGVINDYATFDVVDMWTDAAKNTEGVIGGLVGSSLGLLMVTCFEKVISLVILIILAVICLFFAIGLTPSYVVSAIRNSREAKMEQRALEEEEALRLKADAEAEERKHKNRIMAEQLRVKEEQLKSSSKIQKSMTVDELVSNEEPVGMAEPEVEYKALDMSTLCATPSKSSDVYIGTDGSIVNIADSSNVESDEKSTDDIIEDFGGDPSFDSLEYSGVQSVLDTLAGKEAPKVEKKEESKPVDEVTALVDGLDEKESDSNSNFNLEKIENDELLSEMAAVTPEEGKEDVEVIAPYVFPPVDMLAHNPNAAEEDYSKELNENAQNLLSTLASFKVSIDAITYSRGPTITRYELKPAAGTRVRAIANLVDDIALSLATTGVRIEAPIPNKPAVGIEVPNRTRATVYLRDLIDSPKFFEAKSRLTACLGMDVGGNPIYFDISKMPHLLIAGATGMGKSVCINTIIISLLYKAKPDELKLILIDPKKVEFNIYKNSPHLYAPIVSDPKKAAGALASAVAEMERRFELIEDVGVRDIAGYNAVTENDPEREFMPHMVIIIDELADLMMTAPDEVETSICRLAQKARAAGIHIIIGTQRPSVDVITGLIKANIPSRIACTVASQTDSRTILDIAGAEKLIGRGDMLFAPVGASKPMRVQGAFVSEGEVENIVTYIRDNNAAGKFNSEFVHRIEEEAAKCGMGKKNAQAASFDSGSDGESEGGDSKFNEAVKLAIEEGKISTSLMQRRLGVGYGRAAKIIDAMEERGYVSKPDGNKPRRVLITMDEYMRRKMDNELDDISDDEI